MDYLHIRTEKVSNDKYHIHLQNGVHLIGTARILFFDTNGAYILGLDIEEVFRGKGYGDIFMKHIFAFARMHNRKKIYLIDVSNRVRQPHNIYEKHGFIYTSDYDEMCLTIE